ncbi:MAG TPA: hypothetical protein VL966_03065 [Alphaproteobacteria bacterium]|jgi:hypothetical protein|nr:hypothetical protein [Alphaproteobacteria bacterium]
MGPDQVARLIAEADKCASDAARLRALAATVDGRNVADDLLRIAAHLDESSARLRSLADQMR